MIQHSIKCEMCDNKHEIVFLYKSAVWRELPSEWLTLFTGDANPDGWHFCTEKCLVQWVTGNVTKEESDKPPCKTRRFVLDDGAEGVVLPDGYAYLDTTSEHCTHHCCGEFHDWNHFLVTHSASAITWIDKELA